MKLYADRATDALVQKPEKWDLSRQMELLNLDWDELAARQDVAECLRDFKDKHGGEKCFLPRHWKIYRKTFGIDPLVSKAEHDRWKKIHKHAQIIASEIPLCKFDALPKIQRENAAAVFGVDVLEGLVSTAKENETFLRAWSRGSGRPPSLAHREYWCAALLPYMKFRGRKADKWQWIAGWLQLIEPGAKIPEVNSLQGWWRRRAIPSINNDYEDEKGRRRKLDAVHPGIGLSPRLIDLLQAACAYTLWKGWPKDSPQAKKYISIVREEMPFFRAMIGEPADYFSGKE